MFPHQPSTEDWSVKKLPVCLQKAHYVVLHMLGDTV